MTTMKCRDIASDLMPNHLPYKVLGFVQLIKYLVPDLYYFLEELGQRASLILLIVVIYLS